MEPSEPSILIASCCGVERRNVRAARNRPTSVARSDAIVTSSSIAASVWLIAVVVVSAAAATPEMLLAISPVPVDASPTWRLISCVVAVCSSTAAAIVFWWSFMVVTMSPISRIAVTAPVVSAWMEPDDWSKVAPELVTR